MGGANNFTQFYTGDKMPKTREVVRDSREYDTTQLKESGHGKSLHRDYSAHFWRWSFARRMITSKDHVLEVGCGEDKPLSKILVGGTAAHVNTYTGVDLNKLKESNSQRLTFIGEFNFVEQYKNLLKLRPEGYDVVVNYEVIEHMRVDLGKKFLKALYACTKPGGKMILSTPVYDGVRHAANHIHEYTIPELDTAITKAGFTVDRRFGTFMDVKHVGKSAPMKCSMDCVNEVKKALSEYFDNDAISNIFGPLYPNHARNNVWICERKA